MASEGLKVWEANIEAIIKINNLEEVTNPIAMTKNLPTPDGCLSYEIFGTSAQMRREKMAYIDLHGHYMYPHAANKLRAYDRTLSEILFGNGLYKFDKETGSFVKDPEGESGPEFLYKHWNQIKVKEKTTNTTKEIETYYKQTRDKIFITKFLLMPPFFRDKNETTGANMSMAKVNSFYNSILSYTQSLASYTDMYSSITYLTQGRIQRLLVDIYEEVMLKKVKGIPSKFGMLERSVMAKNIDYSGLMVISSPHLHTNDIDDMMAKYGTAVIPLGRACAMFFPFIVHALKRWYDMSFIQIGKIPCYSNKTKSITWRNATESFDENYCTNQIDRYINSPSTRFEYIYTPPLEDGNCYNYAMQGKYYKDEKEFTRPMTITDLLYIIAHDTLKDKHVFITRYPLDSYNGQFPARIELSTTLETKPVQYGEKIYKYYPVIAGDPNTVFVESLSYSNTYLEHMGGDLTLKVVVPARAIA